MKPSKLVSPVIQQFVDDYVLNYRIKVTAKIDKERIDKYMLICQKDPIVRFCIEVSYLYMFAILGEYKHDRLKIQKDILKSISNVNGSWREILKRIASCYWYGWSWNEVASELTEFNRLILTEIHTLKPSSYEFTGGDGKVTGVLISKNYKDVEIPYTKGIHIVSGAELSFDYLYGCGRLSTIEAYVELHELLMRIIAIASQRQSTPILVKKTDLGRDVELIDEYTGERLLNEDGSVATIPGALDAVRQLSELSNSGVTAIGLNDDLFQIAPELAADFLMSVVKYCESMKMIGFMVPPLVGVTSHSGLGDSNLGETQLYTFEMMIKSMLEFLMEEIVEKLIRPLIIYNFGEQDSYGYFQIKQKDKLTIEIANLISECISKGIFNKDDLDAFNRLRRLLSLSEVSDEYFTKVPL